MNLPPTAHRTTFPALFVRLLHSWSRTLHHLDERGNRRDGPIDLFDEIRKSVRDRFSIWTPSAERTAAPWTKLVRDRPRAFAARSINASPASCKRVETKRPLRCEPLVMVDLQGFRSRCCGERDTLSRRKTQPWLCSQPWGGTKPSSPFDVRTTLRLA